MKRIYCSQEPRLPVGFYNFFNHFNMLITKAHQLHAKTRTKDVFKTVHSRSKHFKTKVVYPIRSPQHSSLYATDETQSQFWLHQYPNSLPYFLLLLRFRLSFRLRHDVYSPFQNSFNKPINFTPRIPRVQTYPNAIFALGHCGPCDGSGVHPFAVEKRREWPRVGCEDRYYRRGELNLCWAWCWGAVRKDSIDGGIVTIFRRSESTKYDDNSRTFVDSCV